jgi:hypothetical protein
VQQVGAALSVAVLGSVLTAVYRSAMPADAGEAARNSIGDALGIAALSGDANLAQQAKDAFVDAIAATSIVGVVGGVAAAVVAVTVLRPKPKPQPETATASPTTAAALADEDLRVRS